MVLVRLKIQTFVYVLNCCTFLVLPYGISYNLFSCFFICFTAVCRFQSLETKQSIPSKAGNFTDVEAENVVALARKALSASRQAAFLAEHSKLLGTSIEIALGSRSIFFYLCYNPTLCVPIFGQRLISYSCPVFCL